MKKFTRAITLLLVLVLAISVLAIPAMAVAEHVDECSLEVEPRYPVVQIRCPKCNVFLKPEAPNSSIYFCPICGYRTNVEHQ